MNKNWYALYTMARVEPPDTFLFTQNTKFIFLRSEYEETDTTNHLLSSLTDSTIEGTWKVKNYGFSISDKNGEAKFVVFKCNKKRLKALFGEWPKLNWLHLVRVE